MRISDWTTPLQLASRALGAVLGRLEDTRKQDDDPQDRSFGLALVLAHLFPPSCRVVGSWIVLEFSSPNPDSRADHGFLIHR